MLEDKTPQRTSLSQLGEFGLIDHLTKNFDVKQPSTFKGIGDDAAILDFKNKKVVVSLGGGGFINDKIRKDILKNHFSFWFSNYKMLLLVSS